MEKRKFIYLSIFILIVVIAVVFIFFNYWQKSKESKEKTEKKTLEQIVKKDLTAPAGSENIKISEEVIKNLTASKK